MKILVKTVLSGSTSIFILFGTYSWLGMFLVGWGSFLIYQSLLTSEISNPSYYQKK